MTTEASPNPAWTWIPAVALAAFAGWWLDGAWTLATTADVPDLSVYWATALAWTPGDALPESEAVKAVTDRHLGGSWVYPTWGLLLWERVQDVPFDAVQRGWAGVLLASLALACGGWLFAADARRRPAVAAGLALAMVVFQRGIDNALHQGNAEPVLAAALGLAAATIARKPVVGGALVGLAAGIKLWPAAMVAMVPRAGWRGALVGLVLVGGGLLLLDPLLTTTPWEGLFRAARQLPEDSARSVAATLSPAMGLGVGTIRAILALGAPPLLWQAWRRGPGEVWPAQLMLFALVVSPRLLPYTWTLAIGPAALLWGLRRWTVWALVPWVVHAGGSDEAARSLVLVLTFGLSTLTLWSTPRPAPRIDATRGTSSTS